MKSIVGWILVISAFGFYAYGMGLGIKNYLHPDPKHLFPSELSTLLNTMQTIFLANLGVLLGISIAKPQSTLAKRLLFSSQKIASKDIDDPMDLRVQIQYAAVILFLLSLFACLVAWVFNEFHDGNDEKFSLINDSVKMLFGTILTYASIILGVKSDLKL